MFYLYGLNRASNPSGKSKITLICVPCDISPDKDPSVTKKRNTKQDCYLLASIISAFCKWLRRRGSSGLRGS